MQARAQDGSGGAIYSREVDDYSGGDYLVRLALGRSHRIPKILLRDKRNVVSLLGF